MYFPRSLQDVADVKMLGLFYCFLNHKLPWFYYTIGLFITLLERKKRTKLLTLLNSSTLMCNFQKVLIFLYLVILILHRIISASTVY